MTIDQLLDGLATARENGSAGLTAAASALEMTLRAAGAEVSLQEFICRPYAARLAGVVCFTLSIVFCALMWRRRFGWALLVAALLPAYLGLDYELRLPLMSRIGAVREHNIIAHFPVTQPQRTVILAAHYDTKTDLLDPYQRAPIQFLIVPMLVITLALPLTALWRQARAYDERHVRTWAALVPLYFFGFLVMMSGGAIVSARSPGALDDAATVATLTKLAERLAAREPPLEHTEIEVVLFAGEEVGLQGSAAYMAERLVTPLPRPTYVINGEGWGYGRGLSYFVSERSALRRYDASGALVRTLDRALRHLVPGAGLLPDIQPVSTDARSFLAAGIPSVTLGSQRNGDGQIRGLYSAADSRDRIQAGTLEQTVAFLQAALADIDAHGVEGER